MAAPPNTIAVPGTFHLDKVQLVDRLQEGSAVQGQVEVTGHPGGEGSLPPLTLRHVDPPDQSVRDLGATVEKKSVVDLFAGKHVAVLLLKFVVLM